MEEVAANCTDGGVVTLMPGSTGVYRKNSADLSSLVEELHTELTEGDKSLDAMLEGGDLTDAPVQKLVSAAQVVLGQIDVRDSRIPSAVRFRQA